MNSEMLLTICKSCQYCLETVYWNCCEKRFCFDDKIVNYRLEDTDPRSVYSNGYANMGASLDSVVTHQPINNNHLPQRAITGREISELPINAAALFEVFSKSMIFRNDHELTTKEDSTENIDDYETKSEPDYLSDKPNRTKVYFEDEVNSPVTDFEIMFKDELLTNNNIFKIDEEDESERCPDEDGLVMNVAVKKQDVIKPSTVTIKNESKITTTNPIYEYDPTLAVPTLKTALSLPRVESLKGILRQSRDLSRSSSSKVLYREDSVSKSSRTSLNRVDSLKTIDPDRLNKVLARMPHRSASFLNIPEHLIPEKPPLTKSKSALGVVSIDESQKKLSSLSDTPLIKSTNLPRFFADSPTVLEYKENVSLQSIKQKSTMMFQENDFSMPRYYGKLAPNIEPSPVHESKSMPDLRNPSSSGKVSKRLVKIRSKLKPLVIKKGTEEKL